jgi:hypothetical protein
MGDAVHVKPSREYAYADTVLLTHSLRSWWVLYTCQKALKTPLVSIHRKGSSTLPAGWPEMEIWVTWVHGPAQGAQGAQGAQVVW